MSSNVQAKVLRVLEEQRFEPVGSVNSVKVDVRVIAATNKRLDVEMEQGKFRPDLFYRLNVIPFELPPLRDRLEDVPLLVFALQSPLFPCLRQDTQRICD